MPLDSMPFMPKVHTIHFASPCISKLSCHLIQRHPDTRGVCRSALSKDMDLAWCCGAMLQSPHIALAMQAGGCYVYLSWHTYQVYATQTRRRMPTTLLLLHRKVLIETAMVPPLQAASCVLQHLNQRLDSAAAVLHEALRAVPHPYESFEGDHLQAADLQSQTVLTQLHHLL